MSDWWVVISIIVLVIVVGWIVWRWWRGSAKIEDKPKSK
jgi:membrane protein DedA with SNARE-associated domain